MNDLIVSVASHHLIISLRP